MKSTPRHGWFAKPVGFTCQKVNCQKLPVAVMAWSDIDLCNVMYNVSAM
jgi:hypothetical protein